MIVCLEGPSAVGKTSLGLTLAETGGAPLIEEIAGAPPAGVAPEAWFVPLHVERWRRAVRLAGAARFAVLDGDPLKALWYGRVFAPDSVAGAAELYASAMAKGELGLPDLYVALDADEAGLRARRAGDAARTRRNFDRHLALVEPLRRWFAELALAMPGRVVRPDADDRDATARQVLDALARPSPPPVDAPAVLRRMTDWLARQEARSALT